MTYNENPLQELKEIISKEKKIVGEMIFFLNNLENLRDIEERKIVFSQLISLKNFLKKTNGTIPEILEKIFLVKPLPSQEQVKKTKEFLVKEIHPENKIPVKNIKSKITAFSELERETIKRLKKKEKKVISKKTKKPSKYVKISNKFFSNFSNSLIDKRIFLILERNLIKANLQFTPASYISVILFTTLLSTIIGGFTFLFFLFFNFGSELPIITMANELIEVRFLKVFWILFAIPIGTFLMMYFYPSLEKKSIGTKINQELPFATIHMSAISGSMIDPTKIFNIIVSTKEYPYLEKEFIKLINEINIYGYDLVTALKNIAFNGPSRKLTELFNSLATTINSGGDLPEFFNKRAETLLFEHRIEKEKHTKSAETFMDIYISVVIAAPMILMLLLMMMKISGLGIALSTSMITLMMVLGVSLMNVVFLTFLRLKQPSE
jgi:flagellar protein FlaJ